ncbi:MAG: ABC transporter ATP-binding protein [Acidobacteria bacterium]|nr:ABC transporter ATP-binding protein [Acidobacteriota bacterium]
MKTIQLHELCFQYNHRPVLERISLEITAGERVALLGPNGAGKTTLLKLISGALVPAQGTVRVNGHKPSGVSKRELARTIAVVPQDFGVPFAFTAREIVELGRTPYLRLLRGVGTGDRLAVERAMELTDTSPLAKRIFNELSGGERQRVMIALALAQEPDILLLDEPTQQLDITRQAEILDLVVDLNRSRGLTVLSAIHDLNLAAVYFHRLIVLHDGSVLADGPPAEVLRPELLEIAYGGPVEVVSIENRSAPVVLPASRTRDGSSKGGNPER